MAITAKTRKRDGVRTFYIDFRDHRGRRVREVAGTTRMQARGLLAKRLGEVRAGSYVHPQDRVEGLGPTFEEFAERFMKDYGSLRRSDHYQDRLKHIRARFGKGRMREISRADLDGFVAKRMRMVSPSTVCKDMAVLGTFFKKAVEWGVIEASPVVGLKKPPESRPRTRYLTVEEWRRLEAASPPWLRPIVTLAVATGLRLKEVTKLRWEDVDRQTQIIHVAMDTKTGTRAVPMNRTAAKVVDGMVRHLRNPYVFVDQEGQHHDTESRRNRITRWTSTVLRSAGIDGASFHTLRHHAEFRIMPSPEQHGEAFGVLPGGSLATRSVRLGIIRGCSERPAPGRPGDNVLPADFGVPSAPAPVPSVRDSRGGTSEWSRRTRARARAR